jgi:hypothetical protein
MKFISHRGNIDGINTNMENNPKYINTAIGLGFDVEIDVWIVNDKIYLGHDEPQYNVQNSFLENEKIWCHAKNYEAFYYMLKNKNIHCFWHQEDDFTITSKNIIWSYPGKKLGDNSICVLPESVNYETQELKLCYGICSDYINRYKKIFTKNNV